MSDTAPAPRILAPGEGTTYDFLGHTFTDKVTVADGCQFCVQEIVQRPGGEPPLHIHHREDEAFYLLAGRMTFHLDGREVEVGPARSFSPRGACRTPSPSTATRLGCCRCSGRRERKPRFGSSQGGRSTPPRWPRRSPSTASRSSARRHALAPSLPNRRRPVRGWRTSCLGVGIS